MFVDERRCLPLGAVVASTIDLPVTLAEFVVCRVLMPPAGEPVFGFDPLDPIVITLDTGIEFDLQSGGVCWIRLANEDRRVDIGDDPSRSDGTRRVANPVELRLVAEPSMNPAVEPLSPAEPSPSEKDHASDTTDQPVRRSLGGRRGGSCSVRFVRSS